MVDLKEIFAILKNEMVLYQPPFQPKIDSDNYYDMWSFKDLVIDGRKRKEIYFAGVVAYKTYVGFYFMPVYASPEMKSLFKPELLKLLKGKSCFHIKKLDEELINQIQKALADGFTQYQKRGWV